MNSKQIKTGGNLKVKSWVNMRSAAKPLNQLLLCLQKCVWYSILVMKASIIKIRECWMLIVDHCISLVLVSHNTHVKWWPSPISPNWKHNLLQMKSWSFVFHIFIDDSFFICCYHSIQKRIVFFTFLQWITDGQLLGKVSLIHLLWDLSIKPDDITKLMKMIFNAQFGYLENNCDHPSWIIEIGINCFLYSVSVNLSWPVRTNTMSVLHQSFENHFWHINSTTASSLYIVHIFLKVSITFLHILKSIIFILVLHFGIDLKQTKYNPSHRKFVLNYIKISSTIYTRVSCVFWRLFWS